MAKQMTDDEATLKRQARRRLIGALALTVAVVVVLPMVLDNEPRELNQDIDLRIPVKDKAGEFAPASALSAIASAPVAPQSTVVAASAAVVSRPAAQSAPQQSLVATAKAVESEPVPEAKPKEKPAQEKPKAEEKAAEKKAVAQSGFVVQIGAFSNASTARQWQEKLGKQGINAYTEKLGDKTRVRIGPYATREAADKVRRKLEAQGLHPVVSSAH